MLERGRAVRSWMLLVVFVAGAIWYGAKGIYVEGHNFLAPPPTFNPWESGYMLGWWIVFLIGGLVLLVWIIRSLTKAADGERPRA